MDESERKALEGRLVRILRAIYLSSLTAGHVCAAHARRIYSGELGSRLLEHAAELRERREQAASLLSQMGRGRPLLRLALAPIAFLWGHLTAFTGETFSLHMLGNMEVQGAKFTDHAEKIARELADLTLTETLVRMRIAEAARKAFIVEALEKAAER